MVKPLFNRCFCMILALGLAAGAQAASVAPFEIFEATFDIPLGDANPFDSSHIAVDARIETPSAVDDRVQNPSDSSFTVPCFYDGEFGWKLRWAPAEPGRYTYTVTAKTPAETREVSRGEVEVSTGQKPGFVRVGKNTKRHFVFDNGESYFPVGENLGWARPATEDGWKKYLDECAEGKVNWIRIWMSPIGELELEWTGDRYEGLGKYNLRNARLWDAILRMAEERGIFVQLVINHHGQYSIRTNPVWDDNPYNVKNGGFLSSPELFFTNEEAQRHYRDRLRYLVARWGAHTGLLAWEFWNEVDLTANYDAGTVTAWHNRMAAFLRELDPYDHLLTTSASSDHKTVHSIASLDYLQSHAYITRIIPHTMEGSRQALESHPGKPHFFGELSYDYRGPNKGDKEGVILHNQLWASVHSSDAGTAMTWWWDNWVRPYNLYPQFRRIADYVQGIDWDRENLVPLPAEVESQPGNRCDRMILPPVGWWKTTESVFRIGPDGTVENQDQLSQFVYGRSNRDMAPNPVFELDLDSPAEFGLRIGRVAAGGAALRIVRNGEEVFQQGFDSSEKDSTMGEEGIVSISIPAGKNRIEIVNTGSDWFQVQYYWVADLAQRPAAYARGSRERVLVWVHDSPHQYALLDRYKRYGPTQATTVILPSLNEGDYNLEQFDPYTGEVKDLPSPVVSSAGLRIEVPSFQKDLAFRLRKR